MTFRWSFSQWENYNECPARWKFKSVLKLPTTPAGPAAARGTSCHDRVAGYIEKTKGFDLKFLKYGDKNERFGDKPPAVIADKYIPIIDAYRNHPNGDVYAEKSLALDEDWNMCPPKTDMHSLTAVLDAARFFGMGNRSPDPSILRVAEWKTGKPKPTHEDQRNIYGLVGMRNWLADIIHVTTYYLEDTAPPAKSKFFYADFKSMRDKWDSRRDRMSKDKMCGPRPGYYCNWCDFAKRKGGPCKFGA